MHPIEFLDSENVFRWDFTGSTVICDPAPTDTDTDLIVLCYQDPRFDLVGAEGWRQDGDEKYANYGNIFDFGFNSYRYENYNLIITCSEDFYDSFVEATILATELNLLDKKDRVTLFEKIHKKNRELHDNKMKATLEKYFEKYTPKETLWYDEYAQLMMDEPPARELKAWERLNNFWGHKKHA